MLFGQPVAGLLRTGKGDGQPIATPGSLATSATVARATFWLDPCMNRAPVYFFVDGDDAAARRRWVEAGFCGSNRRVPWNGIGAAMDPSAC